ncbi:MAG: DUF4845 domain-containing protein [Hylemonella sp.]
MMMQTQSLQRGITFVGLLFVGAVLAIMAVLGLQVAPTVLEYQAIQKAVNRARQAGTPIEARAMFDRARSVDDINSIAGKDLTVNQENGTIVVSFAYQREIHLFGPAYLTLKYSGRSN